MIQIHEIAFMMQEGRWPELKIGAKYPRMTFHNATSSKGILMGGNGYPVKHDGKSGATVVRIINPDTKVVAVRCNAKLPNGSICVEEDFIQLLR